MQPHDDFVSQALEEFVTDTTALLSTAQQARPLDREEISFWRRQVNAFVKAQTYYLNGVRLTPTPSGYTVPSASRPGALIHRYHHAGGVWVCSCEAGERGDFHWHTALIAAYERGGELALLDLEIRAAAADILADASDARAEADPYAPMGPCAVCGADAWTTTAYGLRCETHNPDAELSLRPADDDGRNHWMTDVPARQRLAARLCAARSRVAA